MKKLRNVVYKSTNLIVQRIQGDYSSCNIAIIVGSGHSVSLDDHNNITFSDPGYHPPKRIKGYGDNCTIFTIYYPKTCEGLEASGRELAKLINTKFRFSKKIILHGHSKSGCCFQNLAQWLNKWSLLRTHIVSVSAPLKGTLFADVQSFSQKLNNLEKRIYLKRFSEHKVDRDVCPDSEFLHNLNLQEFKGLHREYIVSKCGKSLIFIDWVLWLIDILTDINGDGVVPLESQIPECPYWQITASHATSMRKSRKIVKRLIENS